MDDSDAPLYRITYPGDCSDEDVVAAQMELYEWYQQAEGPIAWVADCSHLVSVSASQRKLVAEHLERIRPHSARCNVAVGVVLPSAVLRGVLTAIYWLTKRPDEHRVFADMATATEWARTRLDAARS